MHQAAVALLLQDPSLAARLQHTLQRWSQRDAPDSLPLRQRWSRIIETADWATALADTEAGRQLRQASPMATLLPEAARLAIIRRIKALKAQAHATA